MLETYRRLARSRRPEGARIIRLNSERPGNLKRVVGPRARMAGGKKCIVRLKSFKLNDTEGGKYELTSDSALSLVRL